MKKFLAIGLALLLLMSMAGCVGISWNGERGSISIGDQRIIGNGTRTERTFDVSDFSRVDVGLINSRLYLSQGNDHSLRIEMDENLFEYLEVTNSGDSLRLETGRYWLEPLINADIYITAPEYTRLDVAGAVEFVSDTVLTGTELRVEIAGAASGELELAYDEVRIELAGAGDINLSGTVDTLTAGMAGAGSINGKHCQTRECKVEIAGAGSMSIACSEMLDISIAGMGTLDYVGNPAIKRSIAGIGTINQISAPEGTVSPSDDF